MPLTPAYNSNLQPYNTFGLAAEAAAMVRIQHRDQLKELPALLEQGNLTPWVLGGGSNVLLPERLNRFVIKNELGGMGIVEEDAYQAIVYAGGGVVWHHLVQFALEHGLGGLENLSLIPGTVGAAPIQNIGAYGVELANTFHSLEAWHLRTGEVRTFDAAACCFGYRDSVFKRQQAGNWLIIGVYFTLQKQPEVNIEYGAIREALREMRVANPSVRDVSEAVIAIRRSKLPDPAIIGNAGSFFKNPEVPIAKYEQLKKSFPALVAYPAGAYHMKLAAGWLIEQCGWKGKDLGGYGVHDKQALVLVNRGSATGEKLKQLAENIMHSVEQSFGVTLQPEVNML
jgi:UDP-N-acetylmuramate dehydrogenase